MKIVSYRSHQFKEAWQLMLNSLEFIRVYRFCVKLRNNCILQYFIADGYMNGSQDQISMPRARDCEIRWSVCAKIRALLFTPASTKTMQGCQINPSLRMFGGSYYLATRLRKDFFNFNEGWFRDPGLYDFNATVSSTESLSRDPLHKAVRRPRINVRA